ncbi:MAG: C39 family peptidase, partial [Oscillospiraceae bacterium]|nr:C39 family peptidase [Oscillospiraceae bacterium]
FLNDGMLQHLPEWDGAGIPSLGNIRFTDGITEVVYYNQLDERYASKPFGTDHIGGYGCGPTAMAIVVSSLTDDTVDPVKMAKWAYDNGYWCKSSGSYHALIPAAAKNWGLPVEGCTAAEPQRIIDALSSGKLIVALMLEGHFTTGGHFIVLRGVKDGKILVADPASYTRSEQSWDMSIILDEAHHRAAAGGPFWIIG